MKNAAGKLPIPAAVEKSGFLLSQGAFQAPIIKATGNINRGGLHKMITPSPQTPTQHWWNEFLSWGIPAPMGFPVSFLARPDDQREEDPPGGRIREGGNEWPAG